MSRPELADPEPEPGRPGSPRAAPAGAPLSADDFARQLAADGSTDSPTAWFDRLYSASGAGQASVPWDRGGPHFLLLEWADREQLSGQGRPALVVGTGPGYDADLVARRGFATTAFDVSPTAVAQARARFPQAGVDFVVADLLDLPSAWRSAFRLVVEIFTVQSLPRALRASATAAVCSTVAPGGTLLVVAAVGEPGSAAEPGPPWPLTAAELAAFGSHGLEPVRVEELGNPHRWRAEFRRG